MGEKWSGESGLKEVGVNLQEVHEYLVMVVGLKQKYNQYETLQEDERIYLREIVHQLLGRKAQLYTYLELTALVIAQEGRGGLF